MIVFLPLRKDLAARRSETIVSATGQRQCCSNDVTAPCINSPTCEAVCRQNDATAYALGESDSLQEPSLDIIAYDTVDHIPTGASEDTNTTVIAATGHRLAVGNNVTTSNISPMTSEATCSWNNGTAR